MSSAIVTVVTPTRKTDWLFETFKSLVSQSVSRWRWLVGESDEQIPNQIRNHPHVEIVPQTKDGRIVDWRQDLIDRVETEYVLELDPEDQLRPDAIDALLKANRGGIAYGDVSILGPEGYERLDTRHGWSARAETVDGLELPVIEMFEPCARSMCDMAYAPVGPRLWLRSALLQLGGYDRTADYAEDVELLARAYRMGIPVNRAAAHVATVRRTERPRDLVGDQSRQTMAFAKRPEIIEQHLSGAIESWCDRSELKILRLEATNSLPTDLAAKGSYGLIEMVDVLNRCHRSQVVPLINTCWELLAPGGWLRIRVPSTDGRAAFQDPQNLSFWNQNLFLYFTSRRFSKTIPEVTSRFQGFRIWTATDPEVDPSLDMKYAFADLITVKGQRQPGPIAI